MARTRKTDRNKGYDDLIRACREHFAFLAEWGYAEKVTAGFPECHITHLAEHGWVQIISEYYGPPSVVIGVGGEGQYGLHEAMMELEPGRFQARPTATGALTRAQTEEWVRHLAGFLFERRETLLGAPVPLLRAIEERRRQTEASYCGEFEAACAPFSFLVTELGYQGPWPFRGPHQCSLNYTNGDRSVLVAVNRGYSEAVVYVTPGAGRPHFDLNRTMTGDSAPSGTLDAEALVSWMRERALFLRAHPELLS